MPSIGVFRNSVSLLCSRGLRERNTAEPWPARQPLSDIREATGEPLTSGSACHHDAPGSAAAPRRVEHSDSRKLLSAVLANKAEEAKSLLARRVPLGGTTWPGNFTVLHAAALSDSCTVLEDLLKAARKEGIPIDSRLAWKGLGQALPNFFAELGFGGKEATGALREETGSAYYKIEGMSPLQLACFAGSTGVIPILLFHGALACRSPGDGLGISSRWSSGDALLQLLYGTGSRDVAELLPTMELLLRHGADPLACKPGEVWEGGSIHEDLGCFPIADQSLPRAVRRCLVSLVKQQHRRGQFQLASRAERLLLVCAAGLCDDDDALRYFWFQPILPQSRLMPARFQPYCPGYQVAALREIPYFETAALLGAASCLDILDALPEPKANSILKSTAQADVHKLLQEAVTSLRPKTVRTLLPHIGGQPAYDGAVDVHEFWYTSLHKWDLGPCPVWGTLCRLLRVSSDPGWHLPGMAVLAHLTEAGLRPLVYPVARVHVHHHRAVAPEPAVVHNYEPLAKYPGLLQKLPRRVLLALQRPAWTRPVVPIAPNRATNHQDFPPAFQAAARAFLLAAATRTQQCQHCKQEGEVQSAGAVQEGGCCLGDLPAPLLERVLGLAAYPLSAWL